VEGIVPVGTTGESPTLTYEEHTEVIQVAIEAAKGRCKVIAGTGSNSTNEAIFLTVEAEKLGADAALVVAPYQSPQEASTAITARSPKVRIPIVLYSIPGAAESRSGWKLWCVWRTIAGHRLHQGSQAR
jgi:4-hydroxy-tetrahydrodipicolinate synthase